MDVTGLDIGALAAALGAVVKSLHSDRKTKAIEDDRIESKRGINERFAVLEEKMRHADQRAEDYARRTEKRLDDGDAAFRTLDGKIDRMNESLNQLIGEIRAGRK